MWRRQSEVIEKRGVPNAGRTWCPPTTAALEARHCAFRGPHPHGDVVLRHARGGASGDKVRHELLKGAVFDERLWTFAPSASMREHCKGAGNCVGALGHRISLRRMVYLNANWDLRMCISDFRTSQRPILALSGQEGARATDACFENRIHPDNILGDVRIAGT